MTHQPLRIGLISLEKTYRWPGVPDDMVDHFLPEPLNFAQLAELDYIIIHLEFEAAFNVLNALRRNTLTRHLLIFTTDFLSETVEALADGIMPNLEEAEVIFMEQKKLRQAFTPSHDKSDYDTALLQFLYTRPSKILKPLRDMQNKSLYVYPLAECFIYTAPALHAVDWLNQLVDHRLLDRVQLADRLYCCIHCRSARLQFFSRCPLCHSIDITAARFLHCFTCGHVDIEDRFLQYDRLRCPRCQAILRHIGSDYDRPMENYHCGQCTENFTEPESQCRCLDCLQYMDPEKLQSLTIYSVTLSSAGRHAVINESITDVSTVFDRLNYIAPGYFRYTINWLLRLARRKKGIPFTLMNIRFANIEDLMQRLGTYKVQMILQDYSKYLRELIRTTDLSTHTDVDCIWLLLPETLVSGAIILKERIDALPSKMGLPSEEALYSTVTFLTTEDCDLVNDTAEALFTRLLGAS